MEKRNRKAGSVDKVDQIDHLISHLNMFRNLQNEADDGEFDKIVQQLNKNKNKNLNFTKKTKV